MRQQRLLVLTTVHSPDDTRIRERLIRTLDGDFEVSYAARDPGPTDQHGLRWVRLKGGRIARNIAAAIQVFRGGWDVLMLHDPETIPLGVAARLVYSRPVVFDVHEDLAAQIASKSWVPGPTKGAFRALARILFGLADRFLILTLAEGGYRSLFRQSPEVFPNYPRSRDWPAPVSSGSGALYVGDVTTPRGVGDLIAACRAVAVPLEVVGPVGADFEAEDSDGVTFTGRLPHPEALERMSEAAVGVSPLRREPNYVDSLPTKVLEYLAMGLAVVATDLPGTRAVVDGLDGVVLTQPGSVDELGSAIESTGRSDRERRSDRSRISPRGSATSPRARSTWG